MGDYEPLKCIMTNSTCYKESIPMEVKGICFCTTTIGYSKLRRFVQPSEDDSNYESLIQIIGKNRCDNDYNHKKVQAGYQFWIGRFEHDSVGVVQALPTTLRGWGCGQGDAGSGNNDWIQVQVLHQHPELESSYDYNAYVQAVQNSMVILSSYICKKFGLDPLGTDKCWGIDVPVIATKTEMYNYNLAYMPNFEDWFLGELTIDSLRNKVKETLHESNDYTTDEWSN